MTSLARPEQGMLPSPCVGICRLDNGCARDANELASWRELSPVERARIWVDLPRRKTILGLHFRLLPWSGEVLMAALILHGGRTSVGALASMARPPSSLPETP